MTQEQSSRKYLAQKTIQSNRSGQLDNPTLMDGVDSHTKSK